MCNDSCPSYQDPVCSANGTTYDNECRYKLSYCRGLDNYTMYHPGSCEGMCLVTLYFIHHFVRSFFGSFGQTVITTFRSYFFPSFPLSFTHSLIYSFLLSSTIAKRQYLRGITQSFFDAHYQVFHSCAAVLNSFTFQNGLSQAVRQSFSRHTDFTQTKTSTFNLLWTTST